MPPNAPKAAPGTTAMRAPVSWCARCMPAITSCSAMTDLQHPGADARADIRPYRLALPPQSRARIKHQRPCCIWLTGLSGAGKSTLANELEMQLNGRGLHTFLLDGDNVRDGLCRDLCMS